MITLRTGKAVLFVNSSGRGWQPISGLRWGLIAWTLWVLASTSGGALGGATFVLEHFGVLILFGPIFGTTQALVLLRYLPRGTAGLWILASFLGWLCGFLIAAAAFGTLAALVPNGGPPQVVVIQALLVLVWAVLGTSQALVLWHRSSSRFIAALWALASVAGAVAAQATTFYLATAVIPQPDDKGSFLDIVSGAVGAGALGPVPTGGAVGGALYGAATGILFAIIARRSAIQEGST